MLVMLVRANANAVRAGANAGAVQCDSWRRSSGFYDAMRQVGYLSKLTQKAAPGGLTRLPLGQVGC